MLSREATFPLFGLQAASDSPTGLTKSGPLSISFFLRTSLSALLVALSYYGGSELGFFLKPAQTTIATFWPPSAILLAAFLLAPTQIWWVFLLAVLPAHFLVQLQGGDTAWLAVLGWFIANTCGPLVGAALIRRSRQESTLFDSLEGIRVFLTFGVLLPPLVKSFLNALFTLRAWREDNYWMLWTAVLSSNIVSGLILIPTIAIFVRNGISWIRSAKFARYCEAGLLAICVLVVSLFVFGSKSSAGTIPAFVYAPLPLLLWATLRFGPGALSASMLGVALISIWNAMQGRGPFGSPSAVQDILIHRILLLHGLLIVFGLPLMLTAASIVERRRCEGMLGHARGRPIDAEDRERHRIARELHDDIVQRLTMIGIDVDELRSTSTASAKPHLEKLHGQISDVVDSTIHLSHEIHPFMVEYIGLNRALVKLCRDTAAKLGLMIHSSIQDVDLGLPSDISHRIYRVAQLALQDIRQRQANTARLELTVDFSSVVLRIADDGVGIDQRHGEGEALTCMREQMLSLGGTLRIVSATPRKVVIEASAPVRASAQSASTM